MSQNVTLVLGLHMIAYLLNVVTVIGILRLGINDYLAQAIGVLPYAIFSYLGSRYFAFGSRRVLPLRPE